METNFLTLSQFIERYNADKESLLDLTGDTVVEVYKLFTAAKKELIEKLLALEIAEQEEWDVEYLRDNFNDIDLVEFLLENE